MSYAYVPRTAPSTTSPRPASALAHALRQTAMVVSDALSRLSRLPHDSREGLAAKEAQLASYGVSWSMDLAYETELARQMDAARQQRIGGATAAAPVASPHVVSQAADVVVEMPALA